MNKFFIIIFFFINLTINTSELNINHFFSQTDIENIEKHNIISRMYVKYNSRKENTDEKIELPDIKYINKYINSDKYLKYSQYEIITDEKAFIPYDLEKEGKIKFYNILLSYSQLSGMKYYSRRDKKVQQFIKEAYRIDINSKKKINDKKEEILKEYSCDYFMQKDNRFGNMIFKSEVYTEDNGFVMINSCLLPLSYGLVQVNDKEEYVIATFFIYDKEKKGFYYYTFQVLRFKIDFLLKNGIISPTTFSNRLRAATIHLANLLGLKWEDKLNPWKDKFDSY